MKVEVLDRVDMKMYGTLLGQRIITTYSLFAFNGSAGGVEFDEVVSDLEALFSAAGSVFPTYRACCPNNYTFDFAQWQLWKGTVKFLNKRVNHNQLGTYGSDALTPNLAAVGLRRGDIANRHAVSTLHIPISTGADALTNGYLMPALKTAVQVHLNNLKLTYDAVGGGQDLEFQFCIPNGPNATQNTPITFVQPQDTVRVMRRRTVGLGI